MKDTTARRLHAQAHEQLCVHFVGFVDIYNFIRRA